MDNFNYPKSTEKSQNGFDQNRNFSRTLTTPSPRTSNSADGLTLLQLQQLRDAWQLEFTQHVQSKSAEKEGYSRIQLLDTELQLLRNKLRFCEPFEKLGDVLVGQCKNPFPILTMLSVAIAESSGINISSKNRSPISATCIVKSGESWLASSSSSSEYDVLTLTPAMATFTLNNSWKSTGFQLIQSAESIFPKELISYLYSGNIQEKLQLSLSTSCIIYRPALAQSGEVADNQLYDRYCWIFSPSKYAPESYTREIIMESLISLFLKNSKPGFTYSNDLLKWHNLLQTSAQSIMYALVELLQTRESFRYSLRDSLFRAAAQTLQQWSTEYSYGEERNEDNDFRNNNNRNISLNNSFQVWRNVPSSFCKVISKLLIQDGVKCDCEIFATSSQAIPSQTASSQRGDLSFPVISTKREVTLLRVVDDSMTALTKAFLTNKVVSHWLSADGLPRRESECTSVTVAIPISYYSGGGNILGFDEEEVELMNTNTHSDACFCILLTLEVAFDTSASRAHSRVLPLASYRLEHLISAVFSVGKSLLLPWVSKHFNLIGDIIGTQLQINSPVHTEIENRPMDSVQASRTLNILRYTKNVQESGTAKLNTIIRELLFLPRKPKQSFSASLLMDYICNLLQSSWALIFISRSDIQSDLSFDISDNRELSKKHFLSEQNFEEKLLQVVNNTGTLSRDELQLRDLSLECHDTIETLLFITANGRNESSQSNTFNLSCAASSLKSTGYLPYLSFSDDALSRIHGLTCSGFHVHHSCAIAIPVSIDAAYRDSFTQRHSDDVVPSSTIIITVGRFWKPYDKIFVDNCEEVLSRLFNHAAVEISLEESESLKQVENRRKTQILWESEQTSMLHRNLAAAAAASIHNSDADKNLVAEMFTMLEVFLYELMRQRAEYRDLNTELTSSNVTVSFTITESLSLDQTPNEQSRDERVRQWVFDSHLQQFRNSQPNVSIQANEFMRQSPWRTDSSRPISPIRTRKESSFDEIEITTRFAQQSLNLSQTAQARGHTNHKAAPVHHSGNIQFDQQLEIFSFYDINSTGYFKMFVKFSFAGNCELLVAQEDDWVRVMENFIKAEQGSIFPPATNAFSGSLRDVMSNLFSEMTIPADGDQHLPKLSELFRKPNLFKKIQDVPIFAPFLMLPVGMDQELGFVNLSSSRINNLQSRSTGLPHRLSTCLAAIMHSSAESNIVELPQMAPVLYNYLAEMQSVESDQHLEIDDRIDSTSRVLIYTPERKAVGENIGNQSLVYLVLIVRKDILINPQAMTAKGLKQVQQCLDLLFLPAEVRAVFEPSQELPLSLARIHAAVLSDIVAIQKSSNATVDRCALKTILEEISAVFREQFREGFAFLSTCNRGQGPTGSDGGGKYVLICHSGVNKAAINSDLQQDLSNTVLDTSKLVNKLHFEESKLVRWAVSASCICALKRSNGEPKVESALPQYGYSSNLLELEIVFKIDDESCREVKFLIYLEMADYDAWLALLNRPVHSSDKGYLPATDWPLLLSNTQTVALQKLLCYSSNALTQLDGIEDIHIKANTESNSSFAAIATELQQLHLKLRDQCDALNASLSDSFSIIPRRQEFEQELWSKPTLTPLLSILNTIDEDIKSISDIQTRTASVIKTFETDSSELKEGLQHRDKEYSELYQFVGKFMQTVNLEWEKIWTSQPTAPAFIEVESNISCIPYEQATASLIQLHFLIQLLKESIQLIFCNGYGGDFVTILERITATTLNGVAFKDRSQPIGLNDFDISKSFLSDGDRKCVVYISWQREQSPSSVASDVVQNKPTLFHRSINISQSHRIELECCIEKGSSCESNLFLVTLLELVENILKESAQHSRYLLLTDSLPREEFHRSKIYSSLNIFWDSIDEGTVHALVSSDRPLHTEMMKKFISEVGKVTALSLRGTAGLLYCENSGDSISHEQVYAGNIATPDGAHSAEVFLDTKSLLMGGECRLVQQIELISIFYSNRSHFYSKKGKKKKTVSCDGFRGAYLLVSPTLDINFLSEKLLHSQHILAAELYRQPTLADLQAFQDLLSAVKSSCLQLQCTVKQFRQTAEMHQIAASLAQTSVQLLLEKNASRELKRLLDFQDRCANLLKDSKTMNGRESLIQSLSKLIESSAGQNGSGGPTLTVNSRCAAPRYCLLAVSDIVIDECKTYFKAIKHNSPSKWTVYSAEHFLGNGSFTDANNFNDGQPGSNHGNHSALHDDIVRNLSALSILSGSILLGRGADDAHAQNSATQSLPLQCLNTSIFVPIICSSSHLDIPLMDGSFKEDEYHIDDPYSILKENPIKARNRCSAFEGWVLQVIFPTVEDRNDYIAALSDVNDFEDIKTDQFILQNMINSLKLFIEKIRERELQSVIKSYDKINLALKHCIDQLMTASFTRDPTLFSEDFDPEELDGIIAANLILARSRDSLANYSLDDAWSLTAIRIVSPTNISAGHFQNLSATDLSLVQSSASKILNDSANSLVSAAAFITSTNPALSTRKESSTVDSNCIILLPIRMESWSGIITLFLHVQDAKFLIIADHIRHFFLLCGHNLRYLQQSMTHWMRVYAFKGEVRMKLQMSNFGMKQQEMLMELLCFSLRLCTEEGRKIEMVLAQLQEKMIVILQGFVAVEYLSISATLQDVNYDDKNLGSVYNREERKDFSTIYSSTVGLAKQEFRPQTTGMHSPSVFAPATDVLSSPQSMQSPPNSKPLSLGDLRPETPLRTKSPKTAPSTTFTESSEIYKPNQASDQFKQSLKQLRSEVFSFECYEVAVSFTFHYSAVSDYKSFSNDHFLRTVFDSIGHSIARRVFELHRGARNKKALLAKQQEVVIRRLPRNKIK